MGWETNGGPGTIIILIVIRRVSGSSPNRRVGVYVTFKNDERAGLGLLYQRQGSCLQA